MAEEGKLISRPKVKIKVFGVGGGGNSVLMRLAQDNKLDLELIAVNTDARQLQQVAQVDESIMTVQLGAPLTRGRGTGGNVELAQHAAAQDEAKLREAMNGADLVFITAGLGGGTGTGVAPVLARMAHDAHILSAGVVTLPFSFEGARKMRIAEQGLTQMQLTMDALITVKNDNIMRLPENRHMSLVTAFKAVDMVLREAISCIAELILTTGVINVDFADVTTVFRQSSSSDAMLGLGRSHNGALEALQRAISSPLLDKNVENARGFILNLTGDAELSLYDVDAATRYIYEHTSPQVNIILGTVIDENMKGDVQAMVIATDFIDSPRPVGQMQQPQAQRPQPGQAAAMGQAFSQPRPFGQPQPVGQQSAASARPADAKQSATQQAHAQPQQADDFQIPAFMQRRQPAQPQRPQGAFAMPAFKLAPDEPHKDK